MLPAPEKCCHMGGLDSAWAVSKPGHLGWLKNIEDQVEVCSAAFGGWSSKYSIQTDLKSDDEN